MNFFTELKRRNVIRMAGLYLVGAWLLTQVASTVLPTFDVPSWALRGLIITLALGFIPALIFSWVFELTPQGLKRDEEVAPGQSIAPQTARRMDRMIIVVLLLALGYFGFDKFVLAPRREAALVATTAQSHPALAPNESPSPVNAKSIAVLPFENLSSDKENAYFADGIQDEILTRLSKIAALKVISRTSTQKYKSAPDNLREVGRQLGVANLLEGSVQKIGNAAHINVQLIRVATDEHLWAESYNRTLNDVFAVEGEVATAIAEQLKAKLTGIEQKAIMVKLTENPAAYDAYLRGLSIERTPRNGWGYFDAGIAYQEAVKLDPTFALAWARLAVIRSFYFFNAFDRAAYTPESVKEAADRAMTLAPDAAESWIAQGAYRYRVLRNFNSAVDAYEEARKRAPNDSFLLQNLAFVLRRPGRWEEAEVAFKKACELDPRNPILFANLGGGFYNYLRRYDDALAALNHALEISPESETARSKKAIVFQDLGRLTEAAQELEPIAVDSTDGFVVNARVSQAIFERRFDKAIAIVERKLGALPAAQGLDALSQIALVDSGYCFEWLGRPEEARRAFTRAIESIKPTPATIVSPDANGTPSTLALAYAGLGEKTKALEEAQRSVEEYANDAVNRPLAESKLAQIQARFGDSDSAIAALPHLLEVPAGITRADLRNNPHWDPLRKDPRFQALLQSPAVSEKSTAR